MLPEISRRCLECGAAVRAEARFCPQCGGGLGARAGGGGGPAEDAAAPDETPRATREYGAAQGDAGRAARAAPPERGGGAVPPTREHGAAPRAGGREGAEAGSEAAGETRRGRAAVRVKEARDNLLPRVERMREEALVVFDETPDDSGLRFVLIAAALFAVFVVFLVLSLTVLQ